ncbi:hypothetical protein GCM10018953_40030 [Streptosporangium nondiastaticum]
MGSPIACVPRRPEQRDEVIDHGHQDARDEPGQPGDRRLAELRAPPGGRGGGGRQAQQRHRDEQQVADHVAGAQRRLGPAEARARFPIAPGERHRDAGGEGGQQRGGHAEPRRPRRPRRYGQQQHDHHLGRRERQRRRPYQARGQHLHPAQRPHEGAEPAGTAQLPGGGDEEDDTDHESAPDDQMDHGSAFRNGGRKTGGRISGHVSREMMILTGP